MLGEKLVILRESRGLKQAEAAESIGVSVATLSSYENNSSTPKTEILIKICDQYEVSADWLLGIEGKYPVTIDTYERYAQMLLSLKNRFRGIGTKIYNEYLDDRDLPVNNPAGYTAAVIALPDATLAKFLEDESKVRELQAEGTIDNEFYFTWLAGRYSELAIPIDSNPGLEFESWLALKQDLDSLKKSIPQY